MSKETVLSDADIAAMRQETKPNSWAKFPGSMEKFARAIEAAVLASPEVVRMRRDSELLGAIESECWDVRFESHSNGDAGDYSTSIEIISHFMAKPNERIIGENYDENLRQALEQAIAAPSNPPARPEYDDCVEKKP